MAWDKVASPKEVRGLGIPNLKLWNIALRCRWPWLLRTEPNKPWTELNIQVPKESMEICKTATAWRLGNGERVRFWDDRWLEGASVEELAPNLFAKVPAR